MGALRFVLADRSGNPLGEIQDASERKVELPLRRFATAQCRLKTTNAMLEELYAADRRLKVYHYLPPTDSEQLLFHGDLVSLEAANDGGSSVLANFADPAFRFSKRVQGRDSDGNLYTTQDKLVIVKSEIDAANSDGETGVRTVPMTNGTTATYIVGPYRLLDEVIAELADSFDGFDWHVTPIEYATGKIGEFTAAAYVGSTRADAVFEFGGGTRANIQSYTYQKSWMDLGNSLFNLPQDLTAGGAVVKTGDDAISKTDHGLAQALVETTDITQETLRQNVVDYVLSLRKDPRHVVTFTPSVDPDSTSVPLFGHDYFLGDTVPVKIAPDGVELVSGGVRIWKMTVEADNSGRVMYTPTTVLE